MYKRILVTVDGSATSGKALTAALQLAREAGAQVRLLHALDEMAYLGGVEYSGSIIEAARENAHRVLADAAAIAQSAGIDASPKLVDQPAQRLGHTVCDEARAWQADLIVVGTHGRRGIERVLLGSGAEQIVRMAPVPVLVVRADEKAGKS